MSKKNHSPGPVPPGNRPQGGPSGKPGDPDDVDKADEHGSPAAAEQDPERRLGNYGTAGEHPRVQPGGHNDANHQR